MKPVGGKGGNERGGATQSVSKATIGNGCNFMDTIFPFLLSILVFFGCTIPEWIFILPWYILKFSIGVWLPIIIAFSITTLTTMVNFSYASFMNPGFLPKAPNLVYLKRQPSDINVNGISIKLKNCKTCHYYRMPRTTHCSQCDHCVDIFDHHCPWVNNCVGRRNYRFFFAFLCFLTCHIILSISICVTYLVFQPGEIFSSKWDAPKVIALAVAIVSGLISVPVVGLLCFHIFLIMNGLTTYEYVSKKYKKEDNPSGRSPFDMGPCRNCAYQLCGPEYPVFKSLTSADDENGSHEVQRELLAKFIENNGNKSDKEYDDDFPLRKVERFENLAAGDALDKNNNRLTCSASTSTDNTDNFSDGGDNENLSHREGASMQPVDVQTDLNNTKDECISEKSMVDTSTTSADTTTSYNEILVNGCGDVCCQIPMDILDEQEIDFKEIVIIPSP